MANRQKKSSSSPRHKYSPLAAKQVQTKLHAMKEGTLRSGKSGRKVTNPKQAITIGLSKARKQGARVPRPGNSS